MQSTRIFSQHCPSKSAKFHKPFWRIACLDLFVRQACITLCSQLPGYTARSMGALDEAMRPVGRTHVRQIDEELQPFNPIHVEMIKLRADFIRLLGESRVPPHCHYVEDRLAAQIALRDRDDR